MSHAVPFRSPPPLPDLVDPHEILAWAADTFGDRVAIATALGPQSIVVLHILERVGRRVPVFLLDTGLLFPETYALKERVEARFSVSIGPVRPRHTVEEQEAREGPRLWARDPDRCCALRKVRPLADALTGLDAWITGLRQDQSATRAAVRPIAWDEVHGLVKISPLATWTQADVRSWLAEHDLPFNPLLDQGFRSVGCAPCTRRPSADDDPNDERAGRWAGRAKTECGIHHLFPSDQES